jgi:hypothetical protein
MFKERLMTALHDFGKELRSTNAKVDAMQEKIQSLDDRLQNGIVGLDMKIENLVTLEQMDDVTRVQKQNFDSLRSDFSS